MSLKGVETSDLEFMVEVSESSGFTALTSTSLCTDAGSHVERNRVYFIVLDVARSVAKKFAVEDQFWSVFNAMKLSTFDIERFLLDKEKLDELREQGPGLMTRQHPWLRSWTMFAWWSMFRISVTTLS